jgi:hypothetical protein
MYNDPFNRCHIEQPKSWDSMMDAAEADIKYNPRLIFTSKHKDWRDIMKLISPQSVSRLFESLPYEVQNDIYVNDREAFADLSEAAKKRFNEACQNYYPDGGPINPPEDGDNITFENIKRFLVNLLKNPRLALTDAALYEADRLGLPSNAMNFLRDAALGSNYRFYTALTSIFKTVIDGNYANAETFKDNYNKNFDYYKKNPSVLQNFTAINPLINDNGNYSGEELNALSKMIDKNGNITTKSIEALGEGYGRQDGIFNYLTPVRVVSSSIGRATGQNGYITDVFDWNVGDPQGDAVFKAYDKRMKENGLNSDYNTMRYIGQHIGMTSDMPDEYKIHTFIDTKNSYNWYTHTGTIKTQEEYDDFVQHKSNNIKR